ncbi:MAG: phosphodiester glycosidase family protein [Psychrobacter sp.]|nr:phosphodiester glycosidase family protein [Psychrobacter sp.]
MPSTTSLATLASVALLALSLSACSPAATDAASDSSLWACQIQQAPFAYSACAIEASALGDKRHVLQLFWQQPDSTQPLLSFDELLAALPAGQTLSFAMNAGMYNERFAPIGYTVIEGVEKRALNLKSGGGNFHLLPNGVLWWERDGKVQITESQAFSEQLNGGQVQPWYATQSGPMLVIQDQIHPKFNPESQSAKIRNGAGVCRDGRIRFVHSDEPVTFYQFATLFKEYLGCPNALFLDGGVASALYAPSIDRHDKKQMGVMIGLVDSSD